MTMPLSKWSVIVPPTATPVAYADVRIALVLEGGTADQDYINTLIAAATDYAQDNLEMSLMPQTIAAVFNAEDVELAPPVRQYPQDPFNPLGSPLATPVTTWGTYGRSPVVRLPRGPVSAIVSVIDGKNANITGTNLERTPAGDRLRFNGPLAYPVVVTYTAGFPDAPSIPAGIRVAILTHVGTLYENRESVSTGAPKVVPHSLEDFYRLKSRRIFGG